MRLLLDAHFSGVRLGEPLRQLGHDVLAVDDERNLDGMGDRELLQLAADESRILISADTNDLPDLLVALAGSDRQHAGCFLVPSNVSNRD